MLDSGFDFYVAPFATVVAACSHERSLKALHQGAITPDLVRFDPIVAPGDILHLSNALAKKFGRAVEIEDDRQETDNGIFVDRINPNWVKAFASCEEESAGELQSLWIQSYFDEEQRDPIWARLNQVEVLRHLIRLCRHAVVTKSDVVMIWCL